MRRTSNRRPYPLPLQLTPPGTLAAHGKFCLVLLCSQPDTVRRHPLRKTQTSSPLIKGSNTGIKPSARHHPCYSGLQVQGTAAPPAAWYFKYKHFPAVCQAKEPPVKDGQPFFQLWGSPLKAPLKAVFFIPRCHRA